MADFVYKRLLSNVRHLPTFIGCLPINMGPAAFSLPDGQVDGFGCFWMWDVLPLQTSEVFQKTDHGPTAACGIICHRHSHDADPGEMSLHATTTLVKTSS